MTQRRASAIPANNVWNRNRHGRIVRIFAQRRYDCPVKSLAPATSDARSDFEADVIAGLSADPKSIPPKYFYDAEGSRLFDEITRSPEYYLTRTETGILEAHAGELNAIIPQGAALVEFGSGACIKVHILLDNVPGIAAYLPVDISGEFLKRRSERLRPLIRSCPSIPWSPISPSRLRCRPIRAMPKTGFFPGSTIGNFEPHDAVAFMRHAAQTIGKGGVLDRGRRSRQRTPRC